MFRALVLENEPAFSASIKEVDDDFLPPGDVTISVDRSTINYKDGLTICNRLPLVRQWPMIAGIDGAGTVLQSDHPAWNTGDKVILNGFGVGESHKGCLAERARLRGDWLVALPKNMTAADAMGIGTAGYTAMLCLLAIEKHGVKPGAGEVLVTGATGGVGSIAVTLLSGLGYKVVAATGKSSEADYLTNLGATRVIDRNELNAPGKPLQKERWAAVVDSVGSHTLVNACAQVAYGGCVAACGLAQGSDLPGTVAPFIVRGVSLLGIDSVMAPLAQRQRAWQRLSNDLDLGALKAITQEVSLSEAIPIAHELLAGKIRGRIVVNLATH